MAESVFVARFGHESNTFAHEKTTIDRFRERTECFGDDISEEFAGTNTDIGGIVDSASEWDVPLHHSIAVGATAGGIVTENAYQYYTDMILSRLREVETEVDGVILALHGAMVAEHLSDGEGPLISQVREIVGPSKPIVVTLDLHGNISPRMVSESDAIVSYETYPHTDMAQTGRNGLAILLQILRDELDPCMWMEKPPVLPFGPQQNTMSGPMRVLSDRARQLEDDAGIRKVNLMPGFHASDVPDMGFSVIVVSDNSEKIARRTARSLAKEAWELRDEFVKAFPKPPQAVKKALRLSQSDRDGPVLLADVGDNPGGGGTGDGTVVLRELLTQEATGCGFAIMRDPEAVQTCLEADVGEHVTLDLGGKIDDMHGETIHDLDGYVKTITDGKFTNQGPMATGQKNNLGRAVLFQCGRNSSIDVILTENRVQPWDQEIWRHIGLQPERYQILVVKSTNHFRADYGDMCSEIIFINSPGLASMDPRRFEFDHIHRPIYPLDPDTDITFPDWG